MADTPHTVAVWAPSGRDAPLAIDLIERHGIAAVPCRDVEELVVRMDNLGCALITSECLGVAARQRLAAALARQPLWSDFPIVLMAPRGADRAGEVLAATALLGNVTVLERPVQSGTLISALVSALRSRRRQYEAREAIWRRDQFLAMLGHELRNPLAAIMLAVESLPRSNDEAQPGDKQHGIIERQARHLARLVDDLLDVARVTSGKVRLQTEPLDLAEVAQRCVHGAELAARRRGIELRVDADPHPVMVEGDLVRLEEVFHNLIANAVKYSTDGARVAVRVRSDGTTGVVDVADTGIGISAEMVPRVFDLFAQADSSLDRSQGGLGIGLTLVRALVELHGGTITASSAGVGHGSTFSVVLPMARATSSSASASATIAPPPQPDPARPLRVLIVEDNADVLDMTRDLLEAAGCDVATAVDGAAGLAQLTARPPDVAFIDIGLPSLDGYEIATGARQHGVRTFLVAMTGYGQPDDQQRALAAGFDRHVTKPVTAGMLHEAMHDAARPR